MIYKLKLSKQALKFLKKYPFKERVKIKLNELAKNPFKAQLDIKKIAGEESLYRLRIGDIRLIYKVMEEREVFILKADNRGDIFKKY